MILLSLPLYGLRAVCLWCDMFTWCTYNFLDMCIWCTHSASQADLEKISAIRDWIIIIVQALIHIFIEIYWTKLKLLGYLGLIGIYTVTFMHHTNFVLELFKVLTGIGDQRSTRLMILPNQSMLGMLHWPPLSSVSSRSLRTSSSW